jgi:hypothetical protein
MGEISITKLDAMPRDGSGATISHTLNEELEWDLVHTLNSIFLHKDIDSVHASRASVNDNEVSIDITYKAYKAQGSWTNITFDLVED